MWRSIASILETKTHLLEGKSTFRLCGECHRHISHQFHKSPRFGFLFDIDGVIVRGKRILPTARRAIYKLTDGKENFRVPTVFVTNAGNNLRQHKAKQLSEWLDIHISPEQVVMSHSPLRMFKQFHDKRVLVSGQGPVEEIAKNLGFKDIVTMKQLRHMMPSLDMVDHKRRKTAPCAFEKYFPRIEAIVLFGEPVRWETNLQLIIDVLLTNGLPAGAPSIIPYPHIPILACNMDLLWMAEAHMPRFGHGCFLQCLEALYKKITARDIHYTALIGKPSEMTYHHATQLLSDQARSMGLTAPVKHIYCVGDNPETDIYGANLYNRYLKNKREALKTKVMLKQNLKHVSKRAVQSYESDEEIIDEEKEIAENEYALEQSAESCDSILVCTGVYNKNQDYTDENNDYVLNYNHRDFAMDFELKKPTHVVHNVAEAVEKAFEVEEYL
ncbi:unnamed protein product [Owenia fusiformis]|uniref:Haloacid dehalogenase-like hydrolase domain-containing 5 n=1 Tax=Owenia fusiformis TaxID=6347 RepID=A0A8S4NMR2_OWEFU|nr:unnamed protein product [Owenia fusiformis]